MIKQLRALFIFIFLVLLIAFHTVAQPLTFRRYSVSDGLSSNTIYSTAQDKFGFMWFGTEDGLNRFDGYTFKHFEFNPTDTTTIPNNVVRALLVDTDNNIWIGTDEGLCIYNQVHSVFRRFKSDTLSEYNLNNQHITAFAEYGDYICIGTNGGGVNIYDKRTGKIEKLYRKPNVPITTYITALAVDKEGNLWIGSSGKGLVSYNLRSGIGKLYVSSATDVNSLSENYVGAIYVSKNNAIWVGTLNSGLNKFNPSTGKFTSYSNEAGNEASLSQNSVFSITEDNYGTLWVGTLGGGLNALNVNTGRFTRYQNNTNNPSSLSNNTVWTVMIERSGTLWIGTTYGLNTYDRSQIKFRTTAIQEGGNNNVYAVASDNNQGLWAGVLGSGLVYINNYGRLIKTYRTEDGLPSNNVTSVLSTTTGTLYVGTTEGMASLTSGASRLQKIILPYNSQDVFITSLFEDSKHTVWIGTKGAGAFIMNPNGTIEAIRGLNNYWVTCFEETVQGDIWIGTRGSGINVISKSGAVSQIQNSKDRKSISSNFINCLKRDHNGHIYVGTYGGGLNLINPKEVSAVRSFNENDGLPDNIILAISSDSNNDIWFSTGNGISNLKQQAGEKFVFRNFNELDGLQYKYNSGSVTVLGKNVLVFGGVNGLSIFNPDEIIYNTNKPAVVITSFKLFDKEYKLDSLISLKKYIELNYNQNFLSFEFSGLNYVFPDKNSYAYILEGSEKEWVNAGIRRYVAYTNLDHGTYRFRVKAANNDGIWNEEGAYITIVINPPFWRTWWFYTLAFIFIVLSILGIFQLRTRNLRRANTLLERRVEERTRQLIEEKEKVEKKSVELEQALNDLKQTQQQLIQSEKMASLGQLTAGIAHEIKNPLNFVNNFSKLSQELIDEFLESKSEEDRQDIINMLKQNVAKIHEHGARANNIVSSMMMHARQSTNDKQLTDLNKLLDDTTTLSFQGMRSTHIDFSCSIKRNFAKDLPKSVIIQQDISRVILNLLNNAFYAVNERNKKQTSGYEPTVSVSSALIGNKIRISIKDNGTGIPEDIKEKIFQPFFTTKPTGQGTGLGLSLSYEIMKAHGGDMMVESKAGEYTEFIITLPIANS